MRVARGLIRDFLEEDINCRDGHRLLGLFDCRQVDARKIRIKYIIKPYQRYVIRDAYARLLGCGENAECKRVRCGKDCCVRKRL